MPLAFSTFDLDPDEFRSRMASARSRGRPQWLWPEISIEHWRESRRVIVQALSEVLTRGSSQCCLDGEASTISLAAYTAGLGPLLGWWIGEGKVKASELASAIFDLHLAHNRSRMERMAVRATTVIRELAGLGVGATVLKGMHTAFAYFPDAATRPVSDIDLLVSEKDSRRANTLFESNGYVLKYQTPCEHSWGAPATPLEPRSLLLVHADDPWSVDLHNSLDYLPHPAGPVAQLDLTRGSDDTTPWPCATAANTLAQPLLLLHLAAHASCGLHNLTPLRMTEMAMVIRADVEIGTLRWDKFLKCARAANASGIVFPALHFVDELAPGTVPPEVLEVCRDAAPPGVRRIVDHLTPATVQRIDRISIAEHFMWSRDWRDVCRAIVYDVMPIRSPRQLWSIYHGRAAQILSGALRR
jgi:hypothetical protein